MTGGWVLLATEPLDAPTTMAVDEALLERAVGGGRRTPVVRLYGWASPTLSVGAHLEVPGEVLRRCAEAGVQVVRRPTGGGAVLHHGDLTYSVVAPHGGRSVLETYVWVAGALVEGLRLLGLEGRVADHGGPARAFACFAEPTGADLEVGGRKICGSAQLRSKEWFLQHGSIPILDIRSKADELLGVRSGNRWTCLANIRPGTTREEVAASLAAGFGRVFGEPPLRRGLTSDERAVAAELVATGHAVGGRRSHPCATL